MKIRPLYKKLDTCFVDLPALLRHLRQRSFVGLVRIDIDNYRAEISFDESRKVRMREFVNGTGQPSEGPGALHRLLARAREAGGAIDVFEAVRPMAQEIELDEILELEQKLNSKAEVKPPAPKIPKPSEIFIPVTNSHTNGNGAHHKAKSSDGASTVQPEIFPLYSQQVETVESQEPVAEKVSYLSEPDWDELTSVTADLLTTFDDVLKSAHLGFSDAFSKARSEVSQEYSFLHPEYGVFVYSGGSVALGEEVAPELLVSGICECLRRILNKLIANPKFFTVYRHVTQQIVVLLRRRQPQFDKFGYTQKLEKIIKF